MKKKLLNIALAASFTLSFLACNNNNDPKPNANNPATFSESIKNTSWQITKMVANTEREINGNKSKDWFSLFPECRKDNVYTFSEVGFDIALDVSEGDSKCSNSASSEVRAIVFEVTEPTKILRGTSRSMEGASTKLYDSESDDYGIDQEWKFNKVTDETATLTITILDEVTGLEFTQGKPTIEVEMKRKK